MFEVTNTPNAPAAIGPYSQAVRAGNLLFTSGQIPLDPATGAVVEGGIAQQARQSQRLAEHPPLSREEQEALRQRARQVLPPMVKLWAQRMGVTPTGVKITAAQTRFGSCSGKDSLCFSLHLMEYPLEAAEAVVVHELAHIRHKNHGPDFYALVRRTLPDYDSRIKLLK